MQNEIEIPRPDDWHVHLRDGQELQSVLPWTARHFARAIVMPNLKAPITSLALAEAYRARIMQALPPQSEFTPLMTFYLTDQTNTQDLEQGLEDRLLVAAKLYPANATTHSAAGVTDVRHIEPVLNVLEKAGRPLLVHAESADPNIDIFDREKVFLETILSPILKRHPALKVVVEHITTIEAIEFVRAHAPRVAATITAHHLLINRNAMFQGGLRPHYYCLPVAKREAHRQALVMAATSGEECFFLGTDSAPHSIKAKENSCGCAGIFSAPTALALYADIFQSQNRLKNLEGFASLNGPRFYGLPVNKKRIRLKKSIYQEPMFIQLNPEQQVAVFEGGRDLNWAVELV
ncbi:MAG: dihydroorotase [Bdellovibrionales bacterium]